MNEAIFDPTDHDTDASFTKRDLYVILFKHKWLILLMWGAVTFLVAYALIHLPPVYVAEGKVLVKTEQQGRPSLLSGIAAYKDALDTDPSNKKIETEMEILLARPLVEQVVRELDLKITDVYQPPYVHLLIPVGTTIDWIKLHWFGLPPGPSREFDRTVDALLKSLKVAPGVSKSGEATPNIFVVKFQAANASTARNALDRLLSIYLLYSNNLDQKYGEKAYSILEQKVQSAQGLVTEAQKKIQVFSVANSDASYMAIGPAKSLGSQPIDAEGGSGVSRSNAGSSATGESSTGLLRTKLTQLQLELEEQRQLYTNKVESVHALEATIKQVSSRLFSQVARDAERNSTFGALQRELQLAEDNLFDLKRKLTQIGLFLEMNPGQASSRIVVDPPREPDSSEWKKSVVIGAVISFAGLLLGLALASFSEYADHRLGTPRDVARHIDIPVLAVIDRLNQDQIHRLLDSPLKRVSHDK